MSRTPRHALVALVPLLLLAAPAVAEDGDASHKELVKYRQLEMGAVARHFGAAKRIVTGQVDRPADLGGHTQALVELSKDLVAQYPEGTGPDHYETEALPKIWSDPEGFAKAAAAFEKAAAALHEAAQSGQMDAARTAWEKLGDACGGCHDTYRKEH